MLELWPWVVAIENIDMFNITEIKSEMNKLQWFKDDLIYIFKINHKLFYIYSFNLTILSLNITKIVAIFL
jgi:hypothetical protein